MKNTDPPIKHSLEDGDHVEKMVIIKSIVYYLVIRESGYHLVPAPVTLKQLIGLE